MMIFKAILFLYSFEMGLIPAENILLYDTGEFSREISTEAVYCDYQMSVDYKILRVGGGVTSYSTYVSGINYKPLRIDFNFEAVLHYDKISVGFKHQCFHPVLTNYSRFPLPKLDAASDIFFLRLTNKI